MYRAYIYIHVVIYLDFSTLIKLLLLYILSTLAQQKSFQILSMDDFHNINAVKTPSERILTNAVHMATLLLDIQPSVDAVPRPLDPTNIH